jgi:NADP-dependent 3-hydroxy acid dehydrogenase YdfG
MSNIENKVVVITGASSGIGEATARLLVEKGAKVVLGARRADRLAALKEALGENAIYQVTDVTKVEEVRNLLTLAMRTFGKVDVLYNNAGVMPMGNLSTAVYDQWQNAVNINIMGVLHGIGEVLPLMHK